MQIGFPLPVVIGAVINKRDELLLIRRNKQPYKNHWVLPGGKWKRDESLDEALRREILEETSYGLRDTQLVAIISEKLVDKNGNILNHFLLFFCLGSPNAAKNDTKTQEGICRWFSRKNIERIMIAPVDKRLIDAYFVSQGNLGILRFYNVILQELSCYNYEILKFHD